MMANGAVPVGQAHHAGLVLFTAPGLGGQLQRAEHQRFQLGRSQAGLGSPFGQMCDTDGVR